VTGDCAGFNAGVVDGHHLQNRRPALVPETGSRRLEKDVVDYPDIELG
jgi:uncharacterized cupin superfamily protein